MQPEESQVNISTLAFWLSNCVLPSSALCVSCIHFCSNCTWYLFAALSCLDFRIEMIAFTVKGRFCSHRPAECLSPVKPRQAEPRDILWFVFCVTWLRVALISPHNSIIKCLTTLSSMVHADHVMFFRTVVSLPRIIQLMTSAIVVIVLFFFVPFPNIFIDQNFFWGSFLSSLDRNLTEDGKDKRKKNTCTHIYLFIYLLFIFIYIYISRFHTFESVCLVIQQILDNF